MRWAGPFAKRGDIVTCDKRGHEIATVNCELGSNGPMRTSDFDWIIDPHPQDGDKVTHCPLCEELVSAYLREHPDIAPVHTFSDYIRENPHTSGYQIHIGEEWRP